ncbi:hypothetical protein E4U42_001274 [Claviceps africana]|uniref:mRNA export factor GLE1 n=1 Tax=Claviceps africana TaxID=83212 RepID=A0A8K0NF97_9HYPO|nr:hypothetical protein E4U42_001274 [Claviceps africana]
MVLVQDCTTHLDDPVATPRPSCTFIISVNAMPKFSPQRKSQQLSNIDRGNISTFLLDDRNSEWSHRDALAAAQAEHDRVRELALRVFDLHNLQEKHNQIVEQERREKKRLRAEAAIAAEEKRLQELKAKSVPKPPPPPPVPEPEPPKAVVKSAEKPFEKKRPASPPPEARKVENPALAQFKAQSPSALPAPPNPQPHQQHQPQQQQQQQVQPNGLPANNNRPPSVATQNPVSVPLVQPAQPKPSSLDPLWDRYIEIHQALKKLRTDVISASKAPDSPLKGKVGSLRREIRISIGQLTGVKGANVQITSKLMALLRQSLDGQLPSPMVDASQFVARPRPPTGIEGPSDGPALPSMFVYLINIIAKNIIRQFINECRTDPKAADPIGVFTAQIFSHQDFSWRGQSLMDIVVAKFRVVCPVLFGSRGNEKLEGGRKALGWKKEGPSWIPEQKHYDRMAGLGAGFASIALRDFSKSSKTNPYPPVHYWRAFACIVNCPADEVSNTQMIVLRAMIDGHEQRFLSFYGNAAVAALRLAVVEFPNRAPAHSSAAGSLRALGDILRTERGLALG